MTTDRPVVLVVDDEEQLAELYATYLREDYEVLTAHTGAEALDRVDEDVDVVLLDRRLPDLSGVTVLERIRKRGLDCRVALVTALEPDFDILEMGLDTYLCKPISMDDLRESVASLLKRTQYDACVREYFALLSKEAILKQRKTETERRTNESYAELERRIESRRAEARRITAEFDDEDFHAAFRGLEADAADGADRLHGGH